MKQNTTTSPKWLEAADVVEDTMNNLLPKINEAVQAIQKYEANPSIATGAIRQEVEQSTKNAIQSASKGLWDRWERDFKEHVTEAEYSVLILGGIRNLAKQAQKKLTQKQKVWIGTDVREMFKHNGGNAK